jgi:hypothetical protein
MDQQPETDKTIEGIVLGTGLLLIGWGVLVFYLQRLFYSPLLFLVPGLTLCFMFVFSLSGALTLQRYL